MHKQKCSFLPMSVTFSNVLKCNLYHISLILTLVLKRCRCLKWSHLAVILHLVPSDGYCLKCTLIRCVKCVISKNTSWLSLFFPPPSDHILLLKKQNKKTSTFPQWWILAPICPAGNPGKHWTLCNRMCLQTLQHYICFWIDWNF